MSKTIAFYLLFSCALFGVVHQAMSYQTPQTTGLTFVAGTNADFPQIIGRPPDTLGTIGPEQYLMVINNGIRSFNRDGIPDDVLNVSANSFFGVDEIYDLFDPRVLYDHWEDRWIILYDSVPVDLINNTIYMAFSDSGVITECTKWKVFAFNHALVPDVNDDGGIFDRFLDFPTLGMDENAYYVGGTSFTAIGTFRPVAAFVIPKALLYGQVEPTITAFRNINFITDDSLGSTLQGVTNFDHDPQFGYMFCVNFYLNAPLSDPDDALFWRIENAGTNSPSISPALKLPLPQPINFDAGNAKRAPHKGNLAGTAGFIDTGGRFMTNGVVRDGHFYFCFDLVVNKDGVPDATGDRMGVMWLEYDLSAGGTESLTTVPTLIQYGVIYDSRDTQTPRFYTWPSLAVNKRGDIVVGGTVSSEEEYLNCWYAGRLKNDPAGTIGDPVLFTDTQYAYNFAPDNNRGQRWGDYSSVYMDPKDDLTFWTIQEAVAAPNIHACYVARIDSPTA